MLITEDQFRKTFSQYGYNIDSKSVKCINMGDGDFAENGEVIGTIGLGPCVGLIAYCEDFSYVSHVDLGNMIGYNFDDEGNSIRLNELFKKALRCGKDNEKQVLYFGTVSSQSFVYDKKWWREEEFSLEKQIDKFVVLCKALGIEVVRLPHIRSRFVLIDSQNGDYVVSDGSYCVKRNFNDPMKQKYLYSIEDAEMMSVRH